MVKKKKNWILIILGVYLLLGNFQVWFPNLSWGLWLNSLINLIGFIIALIGIRAFD